MSFRRNPFAELEQLADFAVCYTDSAAHFSTEMVPTLLIRLAASTRPSSPPAPTTTAAIKSTASHPPMLSAYGSQMELDTSAVSESKSLKAALALVDS